MRNETEEPISRPGIPRRVSEPGAASKPLYLASARVVAPVPKKQRLLQALPWVIVALPAVYQLVLLVTAIAGRIGYPYDLEWMEGGMLHHAMRIKNGDGIYVPPSVDFIPYLYTPLYPSLLALVGGTSYFAGRLVSVLSLVGIGLVGGSQLASKRHQHAHRGPAIAGAVLGLGIFTASYPYMEGWFDLVRADTLFLFMITAGIAFMPRWCVAETGFRGHARVAAGGAVLALSFFCKQTGIIYVGLGGMIVLVVAWRRIAAYVAAAGLLGLGGTWFLNRTTHGWFWTYVSKIHRAHDFNMDRFWKSFSNIFLKFPTMTAVIVTGIVVVGWTWFRYRKLPPQAQPFVLWTATFAVSVVVGAIGWGTEFAHFNAYMPAFLHGGLAAGAAIPAVYECWRLAFADHERRDAIATGGALGLAAVLAAGCWVAVWNPQVFIPTAKDKAAGDKLVARIRAIDGKVWMPSHPWYVHLAGKPDTFVHRMGVKDVTTRQTRVVEGLDEALRSHAFAAIIVDDRDLHQENAVLPAFYHPALKLPADERPRLFTGAKVVPDMIWLPSTKAAAPPGSKVLFDFEQPTWGDWKRTGAAWGAGPVQSALPGQALVLGASGERFATSFGDGEAASGRITSPPFTLDGARLVVHAGGGTDATKLRIELWVDDQIAATASVPEPGGETLKELAIPIPAELRGKQATLVLVDDSPSGHLTVDDVWLSTN